MQFYSYGNPGDYFVIDFENLPELNPGVTVRDSAGKVVVEDNTGRGLIFQPPGSSTLTVEFHARRDIGAVTGQYIAIFHRSETGILGRDAVSGFDSAVSFPDGTGSSTHRAAVGVLSSAQVPQIYALNLNEGETLQASFDAGDSRTLTLYNDRGEFVTSMMSYGRMHTGGMPLGVGAYFLAVSHKRTKVWGPTPCRCILGTTLTGND